MGIEASKLLGSEWSYKLAVLFALTHTYIVTFTPIPSFRESKKHIYRGEI